MRWDCLQLIDLEGTVTLNPRRTPYKRSNMRVLCTVPLPKALDAL